MAQFRMWKDRKTNNHVYADRKIKSLFDVAGTKVIIHKYIGSYDKKGNPIDGVSMSDVLFMENRNRRYSKDLYEMMTVYEMSDDDFELSQFGFMKTDTLYLDFHMNEMVKRIGRKLSSGDVIELLHLRDDLLAEDEGGINVFYVVEEGRRPVAGYHSNWLPHMWRVRVSKMTDSTMFNDITENNDDFQSILDKINEVNEGIVKEATDDVPYEQSNIDYVYDARYDGLITPPSDLNLEDIPRLTTFPIDGEDGDYVFRTDYQPLQLFQLVEGVWRLVQLKEKNWVGPHQYTETFVQNDTESCIDGEIIKESQYITNPLGIEEDDEDAEIED